MPLTLQGNEASFMINAVG